MTYTGPPIPPIRRFGIDVEQQTATIELADGVTFSVPFPPQLAPVDLGLKRAIFDTERGEFVATLPMGDDVTLEIAESEGQAEEPRGPVVYLDQLHWIALAKRLWAPTKLRKADYTAAEELVEMAKQREITLVISAANVTEATQTDGRHRRHVATTMLGLSRGWQMRSPLAIRAQELRAVLSGDDPRVNEPFTLRSGAIFADGQEPVDAPEDFPADWQRWLQSVVAVNAIVASIIEDKKILKTEGDAMADKWARSHHELAIYMRDHNTAKEHVRINSRARLISDLSQEIAAAANDVGFDQKQLTTWLEEGLEQDFARMPYLGRHYEVIHQRLSNADDRWEANDLTDINFLACAAGYADVVVGEKKMSEYLKRVAPKVTDGAFVCRNLPAALEHLQERREDSDSA